MALVWLGRPWCPGGLGRRKGMMDAAQVCVPITCLLLVAFLPVASANTVPDSEQGMVTSINGGTCFGSNCTHQSTSSISESSLFYALADLRTAAGAPQLCRSSALANKAAAWLQNLFDGADNTREGGEARPLSCESRALGNMTTPPEREEPDEATAPPATPQPSAASAQSGNHPTWARRHAMSTASAARGADSAPLAPPQWPPSQPWHGQAAMAVRSTGPLPMHPPANLTSTTIAPLPSVATQDCFSAPLLPRIDKRFTAIAPFAAEISILSNGSYSSPGVPDTTASNFLRILDEVSRASGMPLVLRAKPVPGTAGIEGSWSAGDSHFISFLFSQVGIALQGSWVAVLLGGFEGNDGDLPCEPVAEVSSMPGRAILTRL